MDIQFSRSQLGLNIISDLAAEKRLTELRASYDPYINALSEFFLMPVPPWILAKPQADNWQESSQNDSDRLHTA